MFVPAPPAFGFRRTVLSHGWCSLPPFRIDRDTWTLWRNRVAVTEAVGGVRLRGTRRKRDATAIAHCLRFEDDLSEFYDLAAADPGLAWVPAEGAGRMLRSPTVFEDLVKLICTTNCSWALTEKTVGGLVGRLGAVGEFPTPGAVAAAGEDVLRGLAFGYRAGSIARVAALVAGGDLDPQEWLDPDLPYGELRRRVMALPGCGPYVAENLARLCGHHDGLALDSWVRGKLARMIGRRMSEAQIARRYAPYGRWRGLALWCDATSDWVPDAGCAPVNPES